MDLETQRLLEKGIALAREGGREEARRLFHDVIAVDENSLDAWLWLGGIAAKPAESVFCLERALAINPKSIRAQKGMEWAQARLAEQKQAPSISLSTVTKSETVDLAETAVGSKESRPFVEETVPIPSVDKPSSFDISLQHDDTFSTEVPIQISGEASDAGFYSSSERTETEENLPEENGQEEPSDAFKGVLQEETPWTVSPSNQFSDFTIGADEAKTSENWESVDWQSVIARLRSLDIPEPLAEEQQSGFGLGIETPLENKEIEENGAEVKTAGVAENGSRSGVDVLINQGRNAIEDGRLENAIARFREALQLDPLNLDAHEQLGMALYQAGKIDEALQSFEAMVQIKSDCPEAYANLGFLYAEQDVLGKAVDCLKNALGYDPNLIEARMNLADVLKRQGKLDEAVDELQTCISQRPGLVEPHSGLGDIYSTQGKTQEAVWEYRLVLDRRPADLQVRLKLGTLLFNMGQNVDAANEFEAVIKSNESVPEAHFGLGNTYRLDGKFEEAKAEFEKALALRPGYPEAKAQFEEISGRGTGEPSVSSPEEPEPQSGGKKGIWGIFKRG